MTQMSISISESIPTMVFAGRTMIGKDEKDVKRPCKFCGIHPEDTICEQDCPSDKKQWVQMSLPFPNEG